ncbi:UNVERIFIED_CONTAM: hypothetical protein O8I53_07775 [Campylobacter lari]
MKFKLKYLAPTMVLAPMTALSCDVSPFHNSTDVNDALYIQEYNSIYKDKTREELNKRFEPITAKLSKEITDKYEVNRKTINDDASLSVEQKTEKITELTQNYEKEINNLKNQNIIYGQFLDLIQKQGPFVTQSELSIQYDFKQFIDYVFLTNNSVTGRKTVKNYVSFLPQYFEEFITYIFANSPYYHAFSSKSYYDNFFVKNLEKNATSLPINMNVYPDGLTSTASVDINGIIPKYYLDKVIGDRILRTVKSGETLKQTYFEIIKMLAKEIKFLDTTDNAEYKINEAFQPIYYLLNASEEKNYVSSTYVAQIGDLYNSIFLKSLRNKLPENAIELFAIDPIKFLQEHIDAVNPYFYGEISYEQLILNKTEEEKAKIKTELFQRALTNKDFKDFIHATQNNGKIGKFGLS